MWYVVPYIRSQLAITMVKEFNMKQAEAARRLDVTDAAISQYLSGKRARGIIDDKKIADEIKKAASRIIKSEEKEVLQVEICSLCKLINAKGFTEKLSGSICAKCP